MRARGCRFVNERPRDAPANKRARSQTTCAASNQQPPPLPPAPRPRAHPRLGQQHEPRGVGALQLVQAHPPLQRRRPPRCVHHPTQRLAQDRQVWHEVGQPGQRSGGGGRGFRRAGARASRAINQGVASHLPARPTPTCPPTPTHLVFVASRIAGSRRRGAWSCAAASSARAATWPSGTCDHATSRMRGGVGAGRLRARGGSAGTAWRDACLELLARCCARDQLGGIHQRVLRRQRARSRVEGRRHRHLPRFVGCVPPPCRAGCAGAQPARAGRRGMLGGGRASAGLAHGGAPAAQHACRGSLPLSRAARSHARPNRTHTRCTALQEAWVGARARMQCTTTASSRRTPLPHP